MVSEKQTSIHTGSEGPSRWWVSQAPLRVPTLPDVCLTCIEPHSVAVLEVSGVLERRPGVSG